VRALWRRCPWKACVGACRHFDPQALPIIPAMRWDLFCRVIDNHGDLGVCWRLARELAARGETVRLWVDDAGALAWMAPGALEGRLGVAVRPWRDPEADEEPGEVVVEAFGCEPPDTFVTRMAAQAQAGQAPCWINLEYLSAEPYVERSHALPSPLQAGPGAGLTRWFFYPGFSPRTGGLLRGAGLPEPLPAATWTLGAAAAAAEPEATTTAAQVLLFCYAGTPLAETLTAWSGRALDLHIPPGPPTALAAGLAGLTAPRPGEVHGHGSARLHFLPYVDQIAFDRQLARSTLNFVRGEDSLVRALWAGRPFVWQPYVQADGAHHAKLAAFLARYLDEAPPAVARAVQRAHQAWNRVPGADGVPPEPGGWPLPDAAWADFAAWRSRIWAGELPDLGESLIRFAAGRR
jgi:uncharacterized repeat protein (TIGR03837 family)